MLIEDVKKQISIPLGVGANVGTFPSVFLAHAVQNSSTNH